MPVIDADVFISPAAADYGPLFIFSCGVLFFVADCIFSQAPDDIADYASSMLLAFADAAAFQVTPL